MFLEKFILNQVTVILALAFLTLSPVVEAGDPTPIVRIFHPSPMGTTGSQSSPTPQGSSTPQGSPGSYNTATGGSALNSNTTGSRNTAYGYEALKSNTTGNDNTAIGYQALYHNVTGLGNKADGAFALYSNTTGSFNVAEGYQALYTNMSGDQNTAVGLGALLSNNSGGDNTACGSGTLNQNTTGSFNTATGIDALQNNTTGAHNTASGYSALNKNTTGGNNTAYGDGSLFNNTTGSNNVGIGGGGSAQTTGSNNIYIGRGQDVGGVPGESNTCYIGNIFAQTAADGIPVVISPKNQLGTFTSSKRFKDKIKPMGQTSEVLFALKPVTFCYKKDIDPVGTSQFGLVAEDVEKVNPALVARDKEGKPYSVRYEAVNAMLLNEFLKEHRTVQQQQKEIDALRMELKEQRVFIQAVNDKAELHKSTPQTVLNDQ